MDHPEHQPVCASSLKSFVAQLVNEIPDDLASADIARWFCSNVPRWKEPSHKFKEMLYHTPKWAQSYSLPTPRKVAINKLNKDKNIHWYKEVTEENYPWTMDYKNPDDPLKAWVFQFGWEHLAPTHPKVLEVFQDYHLRTGTAHELVQFLKTHGMPEEIKGNHLIALPSDPSTLQLSFFCSDHSLESDQIAVKSGRVLTGNEAYYRSNGFLAIEES